MSHIEQSDTNPSDAQKQTDKQEVKVQMGLITDYKAQMQVPADWNEQKDLEYFKSLFPGQEPTYAIPSKPISKGYRDLRYALCDAIANTPPGRQWEVAYFLSDEELVKSLSQ